MNVVLTIDGREAVPVRAIPMLTNWQVFTPDEIADLASCHEAYMGRYVLNTYRKTDGVIRRIPASWWDGYVVKELLAISEKIKLEQPGHNTGYLQWRNESLEALPPGAFVWRDELEVLHQRKFGPEGEVVGWESAGGEMGSEEVARRFQTLDFEPFVPGEWAALLMAGFDPVFDPAMMLSQVISSPPVEASIPRPLQRWPAQEAVCDGLISPDTSIGGIHLDEEHEQERTKDIQRGIQAASCADDSRAGTERGRRLPRHEAR